MEEWKYGSYWIAERELEESRGRNQILSFLHSARRPRYIRPQVVLVRRFGSSDDSVY